MPVKLGLGMATAALALLLVLVVAISGGNRASAQTPDPTSTNTPVPSTNTPAATSTPSSTATAAPTATPIAGLAARVQLSSTPASCGGSTVSAFVTDGFGNPVPNGTSVFYSTNLGSITSAVTSGGFAAGTLTVPTGIVGPAIVNATAGSVSNSIVVPFTPCTAATAVATAPASTSTPVPGQGGADQSQSTQPQQQQQQSSRPQTGGIAPPNTGDGGLLH